jgi:RimJ/RimL family protein N-acetyltransferase
MFGGDAPSSLSISREDVEMWYERISADPLAWTIEHKERFIGTVRLHSLDEHDRRGQIAIGILDPALLGHGLGTETMQLVVRHAFETLTCTGCPCGCWRSTRVRFAATRSAGSFERASSVKRRSSTAYVTTT